MTILFIEYPKCSTCQKARKWLIEHNIDFDSRNIVEENPTANELRHWLTLTDAPLKNFFNTSGLLYKSMGLKDKIPTMSENERIDLLSSNGMLVKRPLIIGKNFVCMGFKESEWNRALIK